MRQETDTSWHHAPGEALRSGEIVFGIPIAPAAIMRFLGFSLLLTVLPSTVLAAGASGSNDGTSAAAETLHRRAGVFANLGLFSATGFGGLSYAYAPADLWAFEAGVGYGLTGVQLSLMPKLLFGRKHRLVLGLGPSVGLGHDQLGLSLWVNSDIGYEYRADNGFSLSLVVGVTKGIAGCVAERCRPGGAGWGDESDTRAFLSERAADWSAPQGRIIIGKWF